MPARDDSDVVHDAVNVRDFGAVGDHVHDDAPAIQAAVDEVIKRSTRRSNVELVIRFPTGQFRLGSRSESANPGTLTVIPAGAVSPGQP